MRRVGHGHRHAGVVHDPMPRPDAAECDRDARCGDEHNCRADGFAEIGPDDELAGFGKCGTAGRTLALRHRPLLCCPELVCRADSVFWHVSAEHRRLTYRLVGSLDLMPQTPEHFETRAIHAGQPSDPRTGAVVPPIFQVSTYQQDAVGNPRDGWEYSRSGNPTRAALEECMASLEGGARGLAFASGLAAEDCVLRTLCAPGDHVVVPGDAYGGTFRLVNTVFGRWGVEYTTVHLADLDAVRAAMRPNTKVLWCETPTNPLLSIADIGALAGIAHEAGALLVVDNTFASPYLQQPLSFGADVVVHSTTKYLGGHSDVVGGALVAANAELGERLAFHQNAIGSVAGPFDSWLVLRGIKTLAVRMDRH